ncbi:MAG: hypothetical protein H6R27_1860, partial [Proteobacteria bacterium]|nr:hypothetical protein [Pseudomonadota bacterium]
FFHGPRLVGTVQAFGRAMAWQTRTN